MPDLSWAFGLECTNFVSPPLQFPNRALFFGENPNLIFDRMMNRLNIFEFRQNGLRRKASYDTFYVKIFFSFFVIFNRQWSHGKGFSCQCVVNLRNSIKFWWDFLQCGGHGVVGWFNALSAFRPTFNLMASAGRSCTGNNDFFFWFQLQKCPCCVIYWCF